MNTATLYKWERSGLLDKKAQNLFETQKEQLIFQLKQEIVQYKEVRND